MPSLFVLPKQVPLSSSASLMAGAKLLFSATGSSTPQNTYTDILLTTPSANPVIADANGVFPVIYLDPSLPNYRVILKTSADVVLYTVDDVPSNQNTAQTFRLISTNPKLIFQETDAGAGQIKSQIQVSGGIIFWQLLNDAENLSSDILRVEHSALTIGDATFLGRSIKAGTFPATLSGYAAPPALTVSYSIERSLCTLRGVASAASNSTALSFSGVPAACQPATDTIVPCMLLDNSVAKGGWAKVEASTGIIRFGTGIDNNAAGFTAANLKGFNTGWVLVYPLV